MSIVPKDSVRFQVAIAVLVMITLSWVISTGLANYMNYLSMKSVRQEMMKHPEAYPRPIPEPTFGVLDFFLGRPPRSLGEVGSAPPPPRPPDQRPPDGPPPPEPGNMGQPPPPGPSPGFFSPLELSWVLIRLAVAIGLAALAGLWIGRRLTRPLMELADGARAFNSRNFGYRIPTAGKSEFAAVADAMNEMADEVSRHISKLEDDADRRRQFLADVAHELRSPITTIRTMAGALQDGLADEPERRERAVSSLVRTSERMLRLVQEVMELVELDLDRLPIARRETDLRSLVASSLASHETDAATAGIVLMPMTPGAPVVAGVDPDRITQVLDNIIANAVSYAGKGATVGATIEDGERVRITISDTGVGIPEEDLPHILDSFYRVDTARTPGEDHIGLGLSIARRMVEAHGGELSIASEQGRGASVTITIPKQA